jgi:hypothetical protein
VIVGQLNVSWPIRGPNKANPELIVDTNRVLPGSIAFESFKPVLLMAAVL